MKAARIAVESFPDARVLQRNCSPVHFPHLSPLRKRYMYNF